MNNVIKILHVDDNRLDRELVKDSLVDEKYEIIPATSQQEFDILIHEKDFDLVLSDFNILSITGLEIIKIVKETKPGLPIILVTGTGSEEIAVKALKMGAADYVIKTPKHIRKLPNTIDTVLENKLVRESLVESRERYREVVENSEDLITQVDGFGNFLFVNNAANRIFGLPPIECTGRSAFDFIHKEDREFTKIRFDNFIHRKVKRGTFENRQVSLTGEICYIYWVSNFHYDENGKAVRINSIGRNLTKQKNMEKKLQTTQMHYEDFIKHSSDIISYWKTPDGIKTDLPVKKQIKMLYHSVCIDANKSTWEFYGFQTKSEIIGKKYIEIVNEKTLDTVFEKFIINNYQICNLETHEELREGKEVFGLENWYGVVENGLLTHIWTTSKPITERKQAEEEHKRLVSVIENALDCIGITDLTGQFIYLNKAGQNILGLAETEKVKKVNIADHFADEYKTYFSNEIFKNLQNTGYWSGEVALKNREKNTEIAFQCTCFRIDNPETGKPMNYAVMARDLSEKKKLEIELRQAQKMEAIGTLAGGIAHDFNNILGSIYGYADMALISVPKNKEEYSYIQNVLVAAGRAKDLVKQILTFSRQAEQELRPLKIQLIVKEVIKFLRSSIPTTIEIKSDIDPDCSPVMADPTQIHQIIMNLCTNSYQAMQGKGGTISISLKTINFSRETLIGKINLQSGTYLRLVISDNGCGIDKTNLDRIFDPYFTTKPKGEGTGLGLSIVHGIVKNCHGDISVYSEPGIGTTFNILLPVIKQTKEYRPEENSISILCGIEHILLVDDEKALAELCKEMLVRLGYKVTAFSDSSRTWETFKKSPQNFDLLLTDMTMPKMTGIELAKNVLTMRPELPVILLTGFSEQISENKIKEIGIQELIMKPVLIKDLSKAIRNALDRK